ncbi:unnamed protein product [Dibothriocephalus latus]|uniref:Uncharacterized protein n=1 Tax=Dibothriocephalus latus TaxID=60516 RepID=A0A3P7LFB0_DIBLA|nr:unnamed protein product [Dibothriocephalus latus]
MLTSLPRSSEVSLILGPQISTYKHATLSQSLAFDKLFSESDKPIKVEGVTACALSPVSGRYLVLCDDCKRVLVFESVDGVWSYRGEYKVPRRASCAAITPDDSCILVGEKGGYVHTYNLSELNTAQAAAGDEDEGDLMLGHLSLLTCLAVSTDGKLMATADRDEKIRDGTLRLWEAPTGAELDCLKLDPHLKEFGDCNTTETAEAFLAIRLCSIEGLIIVGIRSQNCLLAVSMSRHEGQVRFKRSVVSGSAVVSGVSFKSGDRLLDCTLVNYEPTKSTADVITLMEPTLKITMCLLRIPADEDDTPAQWSNVSYKSVVTKNYSQRIIIN